MIQSVAEPHLWCLLMKLQNHPEALEHFRVNLMLVHDELVLVGRVGLEPTTR